MSECKCINHILHRKHVCECTSEREALIRVAKAARARFEQWTPGTYEALRDALAALPEGWDK